MFNRRFPIKPLLITNKEVQHFSIYTVFFIQFYLHHFVFIIKYYIHNLIRLKLRENKTCLIRYIEIGKNNIKIKIDDAYKMNFASSFSNIHEQFYHLNLYYLSIFIVFSL